LCQNIDEVDEPNARGALIWIVGEYAEKINDAGEILGSFVDSFQDEYTQVIPLALAGLYNGLRPASFDPGITDTSCRCNSKSSPP
jgi:hypothetical protein